MSDDIVQKIIVQAEDLASGTFDRISQSAKQLGSTAKQWGADFQSGWAKGAEGAAAAAEATANAGKAFSATKGEVREFGMVLRELGLGPLAEVTRLLGGAAVHFGPIAAGIVAIAGAATLLVKAAESAAETADALEKVHDATGLTIEDASGLQQAFAAGGVSAKQFGEEMSHLGELATEAGRHMKQSFAESSVALVEARKAAEQAGAAARKEVADPSIIAALNEQAAGYKNIVAQQKLMVAAANDLQKVTQQVEDGFKGLKVAIDPLTNTKTLVDGVAIALHNAGLGVNQVRVSFGELISGSAQAQKAMFGLADLFKQLDPEKARQLGQALKLDPQFVIQLQQGGAALQAATQRAKELGLTLSDQDVAALRQLTNAWYEFTSLVAAAFQKIGAVAGPAFQQILNYLTGVLSEIVHDFETLPMDEAINKLAARIGDLLGKALNALMPVFVAIGTALGNAFVKAVGDAIQEAWNKIWDNFKNNLLQNVYILIANVLRLLSYVGVVSKQVADAAAQVAAQPVSSGGSSGGGGGGTADVGGLPYASGGMVRGPGTGTSDSIFARLSTGEFVFSARAVQRWGSSLLNAMNNSVPRFATGGLVLPTPSTSTVGGRALTLVIEGRSFGGLTMSDSAAASLERFAVHSQIASTGRKPSWRR